MKQMPVCLHAALGLSLVLALTGCLDSDDNDSGNNNDDDGGGGPGYSEVTLDATDTETWTHLNLVTGETTDADGTWHVAAQRNRLKINGGASGPGNGVGALIQSQDEYYDEEGNPDPSVFLNRTPEDEVDTLLASFEEPVTDDWYREVITNAFGSDWYEYDTATGDMSANDQVGWLVRGHDGETYAALVVTDFVFRTRAGEGVEAIEFDLRVQPAEANSFEQAFSLREDGGIIPSGGGTICFHFTGGGSSSDCSGDEWDVQLGFEDRDVFLRTNSGPSGPGDGALFGPMNRSDLDGYQEATHSPGGSSIASHYSADATGGVFVEHPWYAYNLEGRHQLWPNYRVYLIDSDADDDTAPRHALQVINYYNEAGESGHITLRYREAPAEAE